MFNPELPNPLFSGGTQQLEETPHSAHSLRTPESIPKLPDYETLFKNLYEAAIYWFITEQDGNLLATFEDQEVDDWIVNQAGPDRGYSLPFRIQHAVCIENMLQTRMAALVVGRRVQGPYEKVAVPSLQFGFVRSGSIRREGREISLKDISEIVNQHPQLVEGMGEISYCVGDRIRIGYSQNSGQIGSLSKRGFPKFPDISDHETPEGLKKLLDIIVTAASPDFVRH